MEKFIYPIILCLGCLFSVQSHAVKIMLCKDKNGETIYMDTCPPDTEVLQERRYYIEKEPEPEVPTVIMYFVPDSPWIQELRNYFSQYEIPIIEKDVSVDTQLQQELQEVSGGLIVPTVKVNDEVYQGYYPSEMDTQIVESGYSLK